MSLSDIAAIAALAVALVAGLIALAQVAQQYLGTATLIRKCDSIVYGPLPGRGRREWILRQLRFKVVYCIPQFSLSDDLWPNYTNATPLYSNASGKILPGIEESKAQPRVGEASWVSFYRAVESSCRLKLRYQLLEADADHCPDDLPLVPMQISMRNVVVLGLMSGLRVTDASYSRKILMMQGPVGTISSSVHPILGTVIHFTPRYVAGNQTVTVTGEISHRWIRRLHGDFSVGGEDFTAQERWHIERNEARWSRRLLGTSALPRHHSNPFRNPKGSARNHSDMQIVPWSSRAIQPDFTTPTAIERVANTNTADTRNPRVSIEIERTNACDAGVTSLHGTIISKTLDLQPSNQQSVVPWRNPWPRLETDETADRSAHGEAWNSWDSADQDESFYIPSEAPEPPSAKGNLPTVSPGAHDGKWVFSPEPSSSIVLLATNRTAQPSEASQVSWVRKAYQRLISVHELHMEEKEGFLLPVRATPQLGWEVCEAINLDPCTVPLPSDFDHAASLVEDQSISGTKLAEPRFPPDFLFYGKKIGRKEGPHSVGINRWLAAVLKQKERQDAITTEAEDLKFIQDKHYAKRDDRKPSAPPTPHTPSDLRNLLRPLSVISENSENPAPNTSSNDIILRRQFFGDYTDIEPIHSQNSKDEHVERQVSNHQAYVDSVESEDEHVERQASNNQAYVESVGYDSDTDSGVWISEGVDMSINSDHDDISIISERIEDDHQSLSRRSREERGYRRREVQFRSLAERKIRQLEEETKQYRSSAEGSERERIKAGMDAFIQEYIRQERLSEEQREADRRQQYRDERRRQRFKIREEAATMPVVNECRSWFDVSWYWVCQMTIMPGYLASPWVGQYSGAVTIGMLAVVLEALLSFTDKDSLQYSWSHKRDVWNWLQAEKITFPPYARNSRGGVVISGKYQAVSFEPFDRKLPPIQLLHCYDYQVDRYPRIDCISTLNRQLELMAIDSWLSIVGRTPEITNGPANLLRTMPALIQQLMLEYGWSFERLDFFANEGGLQVIQEIVNDFMNALADECLTPAEQMYVLVAMLRTAKVALSISLGPNTDQVQEILDMDVQVHLV